MGTLNQMELQNLRHFIGASENSYAKFTHYADTAVDPQIKQVLLLRQGRQSSSPPS